MPDPADAGSARVPSVMDNDPNADEEVIDQQTGEHYPKPVSQLAEYESIGEKSTPVASIAPGDLADSIAYALDGSGPGPTNETPDVAGQKPITEGITGAGPGEEEDELKA